MSLRTLSHVLRHPMNRGRPLDALGRVLRWQLASRLLDAPVAMPFVDATRLLVRRGMHGATGNVYSGLHEFEDMAFVLHALRPDDLCVDVGANVGAYTVLAAGAARARVLAFEPASQAHAALLDNIRINGLEHRVEARREAVGDAPGTVHFTLGLDTINHVLAPGSPGAPARGAEGEATAVRATTLDLALGDRSPSILKIDVEGYETEVLRGAPKSLAAPSLLGIVLELNGSGARYGHSDLAIAATLRAAGFRACRYEPVSRSLSIDTGSPATKAGATPASGNTLFVRDVESMAARLRAAPRRRVLGREI